MNVVESQLPGFDQVRHYRLGPTAEHTEEVVDQSALRGVTGDHGLENVRIADLLRAPQRLLVFQTIDGSLDGGVSWPSALGEGFLNFADRARATAPESLHDLYFQLGQFRQSHLQCTIRVCEPTMTILETQEDSIKRG